MNIIALFKSGMVAASLAVLAACTSTAFVPSSLAFLPTEEARWFAVGELDAAGEVQNQSLLAVERDADGLRFVQTTALGAPIARQVLRAEGWSNDGFVMPNAPSRALFTALLPLLALSPNSEIYPQLTRSQENDATVFRQNGQEQWRLLRLKDGDEIRFPDGKTWKIKEIQAE